MLCVLKEYRFDAVICKEPDRGGVYVEIPFDVKAEFGKDRIKIHATFDGEPYDGSVVNMGAKNPVGALLFIFGYSEDAPGMCLIGLSVICSPCAGVAIDKFGVMWNLVGQE